MFCKKCGKEIEEANLNKNSSGINIEMNQSNDNGENTISKKVYKIMNAKSLESWALNNAQSHRQFSHNYEIASLGRSEKFIYFTLSLTLAILGITVNIFPLSSISGFSLTILLLSWLFLLLGLISGVGSIYFHFCSYINAAGLHCENADLFMDIATQIWDQKDPIKIINKINENEKALGKSFRKTISHIKIHLWLLFAGVILMIIYIIGTQIRT